MWVKKVIQRIIKRIQYSRIYNYLFYIKHGFDRQTFNVVYGEKKYSALARLDKQELYLDNKINPIIWVMYQAHDNGEYLILDNFKNNVSAVIKDDCETIIVHGTVESIRNTLFSTIITTKIKLGNLPKFYIKHKYILSKTLKTKVIASALHTKNIKLILITPIILLFILFEKQFSVLDMSEDIESLKETVYGKIYKLNEIEKVETGFEA